MIQDGQPVNNFHRSFEVLCELADVTHDAKGNKFTIYSLRHSYAEFQILYGGGADPITLARNMGTSVKMLERYYVTLEPVTKTDELNRFDESTARPKGRHSFDLAVAQAAE